MDLATALELLQIDVTEAHPSADEIRAAYKAQALLWHPDKNVERVEEATERFQLLGEAQELLLHIDSEPAPGVAASGGAHGPTAESLGLRGMPGPPLGPTELAGAEIAVVWRCGDCTEPNSVCCRLNPKKHSCLCGHKLSEHVPGKHGLRCSTKGCACRCFEFHVQQGGWQARCGCKHKHTDHSVLRPFACLKPGCECASYDVRWVCSCGHSWCVPQRALSLRSKQILLQAHDRLDTCGVFSGLYTIMQGCAQHRICASRVQTRRKRVGLRRPTARNGACGL